jgi:SAM-dependent methyltransferase
MRRTLEKLAHERQEKEKAFAKKLDEVKQAFRPFQEQRSLSRKNIPQIKSLLAELVELIEIQASLIDAKDKEWDALGSHHVGLIFKSMEWRVDKLAAEGEDSRILMRRFLLLREKITDLLAVLGDKRMPSADAVRDLLEPLEDWRYAGFENRFRGSEDEVRRQQQAYLSDLPKNGPILDLGCGRGEFLELLRENGYEAAGVDINSQMVDICLDKGLRCEKGDLLEKLAGWKDGSLAGIFSSQVIEHLQPAYLKKLIESSHRKLAPSGVIILETINPTSVFALVQIYHLDISHQKPIHPQALKFMLEASGFENAEIRYSSPLEAQRLQNLPGADERTAILNRNIDSLNELLFAPVNYAAVATRP